ncbi:MAG TPA: DNA repair protein RecN [Nitrospirales bacterium]|nr:DNA repair protein RecN [Nitrospirales bacterium]
MPGRGALSCLRRSGLPIRGTHRMLLELRIQNIAIIDDLHLTFPAGFIVLTGETGAGKSILVDAVGLLIGERASAEQIRTGTTEGVIEGIFAIANSGPLTARLKELDLLGDGDDPGELVIRRTLSSSGRHRVRINGNAVPLSTLQDIGQFIVDIHGQHDTQSLFRPITQLDLVDSFGNLFDDRAAFCETYHAAKTLQRDLSTFEKETAELKEQADRLQYEREEIEAAAIQPDEDVVLEQERQVMAQVHNLVEISNELYSTLYEDDRSILSRVGHVEWLLDRLLTVDIRLSDATELLGGATAQLKELAGRIRDYQEQLDVNPDRLEQLEIRLDLLNRMKKRYGGSVASVLDHLDRITKELDRLIVSDDQKESLQHRLVTLHDQQTKQADHLSTRRKKAANELNQCVNKEITDLHMKHATFDAAVEQERDGTLNPNGQDRVQFLFSGSAGEPPCALKDAISGGELSRVTLCIKTVLAREDQIPMLIFDEIDAGIGGAVAERVGKKLQSLGQRHQVFCITHLPQIAALGDAHFSVEKVVKQKRATTQVEQLANEERIDEIARMLGGTKITQAVKRTAKEMLGVA